MMPTEPKLPATATTTKSIADFCADRTGTDVITGQCWDPAPWQRGVMCGVLFYDRCVIAFRNQRRI